MSHEHHRRVAVEPFTLSAEFFGVPRVAAPEVSTAAIRAKLQSGHGELLPEERGLLLSLLEEHAPQSRGRA